MRFVQEFQSDKVAKLKSDQIDLPKGSVETRKKKEEETVTVQKRNQKSDTSRGSQGRSQRRHRPL